MSIQNRLATLRAEMQRHSIDAYIIPSSDSHQSEYVAEHWRSRAWISGFTGSAGTVVVTADQALLWTDGRYFIQAERQLAGSTIELMRMREPGVATVNQWIKEHLPVGSTVGFDGTLFSHAEFGRMQKEWADCQFSYNTKHDLIATCWNDRPDLPTEPLMVLPDDFAGVTHAEKLKAVRAKLTEMQAQALLICSLDDIAWLFNIRGADILYSPVVISYALVTLDAAQLYLDTSKLTDDSRDALQKQGITLHNYDEIASRLQTITQPILMDPERTNVTLWNMVPETSKKMAKPSPTTLLKAQKSPQELANLRKACLRDSAALTRFIYWVKQNIGTKPLTELSTTRYLNALREEQPNFLSLSFNPIAAYGANAAMMHYAATEETDTTLEPRGFFLVDSGGTYLDGTTDITRTLVLGPISEEQKRHFTLVLKGVIALSQARFLSTTTGANLDILARQFLWQDGIDYKCGTGHGVGYVLNVHEGPQNFSQALVNQPMRPGMLTTIEPGVYLQDRYGIRTENMVVCVEDGENGDGSWRKVETYNFVPIDRDAIEPRLLLPHEKEWLNEYHQKTWDLLHTSLNPAEQEWLKEATAPI